MWGAASMRAAEAGQLVWVAGDIGNAAAVEGTRATARFNALAGIAVDGAGNVYVADGHSIRKLSTDGRVTTMAGVASEWGNNDGARAAARFNSPQGLAADAAGNVYVADRDNHAIRKITPDGTVSTLAGSALLPGAGDGPGSRAGFFRPSAIAVDASGNVFVADTRNFTIRKISSTGVVTTLAGRADEQGNIDGPAQSARFGFIEGIAVDTAGDVYVADNSSHVIRKLSTRGVVTTVAGLNSTLGSADGVGAAARFAYPGGLAIGKDGNLYVADSHSGTIRRITPAGKVTTLAGLADHPGTDDGPGSTARFNSVHAIAIDQQGNVYVTDSAYNPNIPGTAPTRYLPPGPSATVRRIDTAGVVSTLAGHASTLSDSPDGMGAIARFESPSGIVADRDGTLYVADTTANTIRKITVSGQVTTLAGKTGVRGHVDGTGSEARFDSPSGIALDRSGILYVTDSASGFVRKITPEGLVSTLAGAGGVRGSVDGLGPAARFSTPTGIAIDRSGNLFVTDGWANNIRKITPAGEVTTVANTSGQRGSTDGPAEQARFVVPAGIAIDHAGNLYVCDFGNRTIRKITPHGDVTTFAGHAPRPDRNGDLPPRSVDGVRAAAEFASPLGIAVDESGNLYVADGNTIRKVTPAGVVTTIAGKDGEAGIRLGRLPGRLETTGGLAVIDSNTLAVTERFTVLKILFDDP
jgi:sugar lactone lactonase YvrE